MDPDPPAEPERAPPRRPLPSLADGDGPTDLGIGPPQPWADRSRPAAAGGPAGRGSGPPEGQGGAVVSGDFDAEEEDHRIGECLCGYRVRTRIGHGSMGVVYLAEHETLDRAAAIKVLRASLCDRREVVDRFLQEARAASRISSPHVVGVTDFGETADGAPFLVMELVRGQTLAERLRECERLPWSELREILRQVLVALAAAHASGVVHRDMKPDNIMLVEGPRGRLVKVLDFGIAKVIDEDDGRHDRLTRTGMIVGTAAYMSPEQAQSQELDARADLYSVGVIAYRAITGRLPFDEDGFMPMVLAHATREAAPPSYALRTGIFVGARPHEVDQLVMRALAKRPEDRFSDADEMREAVEAIEARDEGWLGGESQPSPWPRRLALLALAALLLMVGWIVVRG